MKKWIPMINCGYHAGNSPMAFQLSGIDYFDTEEECEKWIEDNADDFTMNEAAGCVYPEQYEEKYLKKR